MESHPDTITRLRVGKRQLREERRTMSLPEKVRQVVELQKIKVVMLRRRRALHALERVWPIEERR